jgi:hypothetical protein
MKAKKARTAENAVNQGNNKPGYGKLQRISDHLL